MKEKIIKPIGYVRNGFKQKFGVPRQSGRAPSVKSAVVLDKAYSADSVRGLNYCSHIWLIFGFDRTEYTGALTVRPPRLGGNKRVGVFASRSPNRPNGLGLSCVKLESVNKTERGVELIVCGADITDGTPVYDIKPYNPADKIDGAVCGFADGAKDYGLKTEFSSGVKEKIPADILDAVTECLADDPRPSYIDDEFRVYGMTYGGYELKFKVSGVVLTVISAEKAKR